VDRVVTLTEDITGRKQAEQALRLHIERVQVLLKLNQMTEVTHQELTDYALEEAVRITQSEIGYLAFLNDDETVLTMHSWSKQAMKECAIIDKPIQYVVTETGLWGEAVRQRRPVITNDYAAPNPAKKGHPQGHVPVRRHMNVPVFAGQHIVLVAGVGNKEGEYDNSDAEQLTLLMEGMWRLIERKRAEKALRESEALLHAAVNILPVGLWIINAEGKIVTSSAAAQKIWAGVHYIGIDQLGEYKGWRTDSGKLIDAHEWAGARALEKGETSIEEEVEIECFDGTHKIILDSAVPLRESDGSIGGAITINQDITERKNAEKALKNNQRLLAETEKMGKVGGWEFDIVTQKQTWTEEVYRIHEVDFTDNPTVDQGLNFYTPASRPTIERAVQRAIEQGEPFDVELEIITAKGNLRSVHAIGKADLEHHKVLGFFQDITERKRAEGTLRESEERFRSILENIEDGYYEVDTTGNLTFFNPAYVRILGRTANELMGMNNRLYMTPPGARAVFQIFNRVFTTGIAEQDIGFELVRPDGTLRSVEASASLIKDTHGSILGFRGTMRDITERKQAEEEIQRLNVELEQRVAQRTAQLEAANKELEAFSYSVSHDLRAPLRGIDGWSLALLEDYSSQLDGQAKTYLERVRSETQRMGQLIDDLLQLSRLTSTEMMIDRVDLSAMAGTIADQLQKEQPERQVEFVLQPGLNANGDAQLLEIALTNLLDNAFKFTGKTPQARIEFGQTEVEGHRAFFVRDNGAGFDMALAKKLFGAFQRMHKASDFPGTGVGLTTVQRIVHRHGGRIWAQAVVDQGATFYFTLEEIP
jgi:PAS domain S-box-containing protein